MTQEQALNILKTGANVFLTGEPGSGKTHTVNEYIAYLEDHGVEASVTASTGIAATHLGGMTIHSWSGIGVRSRLSEYELDQLSEKERLVKRLTAARVLIMDEISMLSCDVLDTVEMVCRHLRRRSEPWGGLQVIFVGDFFQLPPIERRTSVPSYEQDLFVDLDAQEVESNFAYHAGAWKRAKPLVCYLTEQHRQEDGSFLEVLTSLRQGTVSALVREVLTSRKVSPEDDGITKLFPKNANVDRINDGELKKLHGQSHTYTMTSHGFAPVVEGLKKNCLSPEVLTLKLGAKVMFTKNSPEGKYVNGTLGEVTSFSRTSGQPTVTTRDGRSFEVSTAEWTVEDQGKVVAAIEQLPLRLAWAITVHKSQGMSLDAAHIDLSTAFEYGQGYVALSRVRTLTGLYLHGFNERALEVHPEVLEHDTAFRELSDDAETAFASLDQDEVESMQRDFLLSIGGNEKGGVGVSNKTQKVSTFEETRQLALDGHSLEEMAEKRKLTVGTILTHLERLIEEDALDAHADLAHLMPGVEAMAKMEAVFKKVQETEGKMPLSSARSLLKDAYSFDELRIGRLFVER